MMRHTAAQPLAGIVCQNFLSTGCVLTAGTVTRCSWCPPRHPTVRTTCSACLACRAGGGMALTKQGEPSWGGISAKKLAEVIETLCF